MRGIAAFAVITVATFGPALAQRVPVPDRETDFQAAGKKEGARDTRRVVQDFAECMARRSMSNVAQYLDGNAGPLTPALRSRAPDCLMNSYDQDAAMLRGGASSYRYALAEAFLVRKFGESGIGNVASIAQLDLSNPAPIQNPGLNALAECAIRKDPTGTWALLRTDAASAEEKALFQRLAPALQACVAQGSTLKMQSFFVRGAIAETYYLLSKAPRLATGGTQ